MRQSEPDTETRGRIFVREEESYMGSGVVDSGKSMKR